MATIPPPQAASRATVPSPRAQLDSLVEHRHRPRQRAADADGQSPGGRLARRQRPGARCAARSTTASNPATCSRTTATPTSTSPAPSSRARLRKEFELLAPPRKKAQRRCAELLALVPMEEMDRSVAFGGISRPFEAACAEQLATLNVRLGFLLERDTLRLGPESVPSRSDPDGAEPGLDRIRTRCRSARAAGAAAAPGRGVRLRAALRGAEPGLDGARAGRAATSMRIRKTDNAARAKAQRATGQAALAEQLRQFFAGGEAAGGRIRRRHSR